MFSPADYPFEGEADYHGHDGPGDDGVDIQEGLRPLHEGSDAVAGLAEHFPGDDGAPSDAHGAGGAADDEGHDAGDVKLPDDPGATYPVKGSHLRQIPVHTFNPVDDVDADEGEHGKDGDEDRHRPGVEPDQGEQDECDDRDGADGNQDGLQKGIKTGMGPRKHPQADPQHYGNGKPGKAPQYRSPYHRQETLLPEKP